MASFRMSASPTFAAGTLLSAYPRRYFAGPPPAAGYVPGGMVAATTAVVDTHGYATFGGLESEEAYFVGAPIEGEWRWKTFVTGSAPEDGGVTLGEVDGALAPYALLTDARFTDERVPEDESVTRAKLAKTLLGELGGGGALVLAAVVGAESELPKPEQVGSFAVVAHYGEWFGATVYMAGYFEAGQPLSWLSLNTQRTPPFKNVQNINTTAWQENFSHVPLARPEYLPRALGTPVGVGEDGIPYNVRLLGYLTLKAGQAVAAGEAIFELPSEIDIETATEVGCWVETSTGVQANILKISTKGVVSLAVGYEASGSTRRLLLENVSFHGKA